MSSAVVMMYMVGGGGNEDEDEDTHYSRPNVPVVRSTKHALAVTHVAYSGYGMGVGYICPDNPPSTFLFSQMLGAWAHY
jgi:hypothetical protein